MSHLTYVGRRFGTIQNHLSSLKHFHQIRGFPLGWEQDYIFNLTLKGAKRYLGLHTKRKQAITPLMLHRMASLFNLDVPLHTAMWVLFLVAFFPFFPNLVVYGTAISPKVLRRGDLRFSPHGTYFHISQSKTIQFVQQALSIPLPLIPGSALCPVLSSISIEA